MDRMRQKLMPMLKMREDRRDTTAFFKVTEHRLIEKTAVEEKDECPEQTYQCASSEMCIFGAIGWGASSVVRKAIHIPTHRILAVKKIHIFEREKRHHLLNEIKTVCEAPKIKGLVEFYGAYYTPDSDQISIALEYMDGGSVADIVRKKRFIPEAILSAITKKVLQALQFLHNERHLVHRDIKPANLLINLLGETKVTDYAISAGLDNSIATCATFVGTVTYLSPEEINNECHSYPADIWSLGLSLLECGTGEFPYNASKGPVNLMLQVMYDPSPLPPLDRYSPEFRCFVAACLQKDADSRPTAEQLLSHAFIKNHEKANINLTEYMHSVFDPNERLRDLADMLIVHYYTLFDGCETLWPHMKTLYRETSSFSFADQVLCGSEEIYSSFTEIRRLLSGEREEERLVHFVENLECCEYSKRGIMIRVYGAFVKGSQFVPRTEGAQVEGICGRASLDVDTLQMGRFTERFAMEPAHLSGSFYISKQELVLDYSKQ